MQCAMMCAAGVVSVHDSHAINIQALDEIDLNGFFYGGANITAFQLIDRKLGQVQAMQREWSHFINTTRFRLEHRLKVC